MAQPIVKLETISLINEPFHGIEDNQWSYEIYEQDILTFEIPTHTSRCTYPMALLPPKLITEATVPMNLTADTPDPLDLV